MKIAFFQTRDDEKNFYQEKLVGHQLRFYAGLPSEGNWPEPDTEVLCVFTDTIVGPELLSRLPSLKLVATRSTGFDHVDLEACKVRSIGVANVPVYGAETVAEYTFALLLALSRRIVEAVNRVRETGHFSPDGLTGFDLAGKTMGVVGTGNIGQHVVKIALGFGMKVLAFDPKQNDKLAQELGFTYVSLAEMLPRSDVVTLHIPYLPQTHHVIGEEQLRLMKPGAVLVNSARGGLVDTNALVKSLVTGQLGGAALDVLEEEGLVKDDAALVMGHHSASQMKTVLADHELMKMPNVILSPHNAFNSKEALKRIMQTTVDNILAFASGEPTNLV